MRNELRVAIVGAGLGGIVAGALLQRRGRHVRIFEQAPSFTRLGAGIALSPNVFKVLRAIGVEHRMLDTGLRPAAWRSRQWDTGRVMFDYPMRDALEAEFGACYMLIHRGDFHAILAEAVEPGAIEFGKRLVEVSQRGDAVRLRFDDGGATEADMLIGADGINSRVREILLGPEPPTYSGYVAHRCIIPASRLGRLEPGEMTKWWSDDDHDDTHIVVYFLDRRREEIYFVTGVSEPAWDHDLSYVDADPDELRAAFAGFHPEVQELLDLASGVTKWPLFERAPLPLWSHGRIVLIGDACHPMKPHMGQGAGMAIEDAAILTRCLDHCGADLRAAFGLYEASRKDRTSAVQRHSRENRWLRDPMDPSWVFGYDAMTQELGRPVPGPGEMPDPAR